MSTSRLVLLAAALMAAVGYHAITVSRLEQAANASRLQLQQVEQHRDAYQAALARVQSTLKQVRVQFQREANARDVAQRRAQQLEADYEQAQRQLALLSQQDEVVEAWGNQPVPDVLVERLQPSAP